MERVIYRYIESHIDLTDLNLSWRDFTFEKRKNRSLEFKIRAMADCFEPDVTVFEDYLQALCHYSDNVNDTESSAEELHLIELLEFRLPEDQTADEWIREENQYYADVYERKREPLDYSSLEYNVAGSSFELWSALMDNYARVLLENEAEYRRKHPLIFGSDLKRAWFEFLCEAVALNRKIEQLLACRN